MKPDEFSASLYLFIQVYLLLSASLVFLPFIMAMCFHCWGKKIQQNKRRRRIPDIIFYPSLHGDVPVLASGLVSAVKLLPAPAVNKVFVRCSRLSGSLRVGAVCQGGAGAWTDTVDRAGVLNQLCMLLLARPVESEAAEHVIGNIRELTRFPVFLFKVGCKQLHLIRPREPTPLVILIYPPLIGVTLHVFFCADRISVSQVSLNASLLYEV